MEEGRGLLFKPRPGRYFLCSQLLRFAHSASCPERESIVLSGQKPCFVRDGEFMALDRIASQGPLDLPRLHYKSTAARGHILTMPTCKAHVSRVLRGTATLPAEPSHALPRAQERGKLLIICSIIDHGPGGRCVAAACLVMAAAVRVGGRTLTAWRTACCSPGGTRWFASDFPEAWDGESVPDSIDLVELDTSPPTNTLPWPPDA